MRRRFFENCDVSGLPLDDIEQITMCQFRGQFTLYEPALADANNFDIDIECNDLACSCAVILKCWESGWGKMPKGLLPK